MTFDLDAWEERSAIMEFEGGLSRFDAETQAARAQGVERHAAIRFRNSQRGGHNRPAAAQRDGADNVSRVQCGAQTAKPENTMPERDRQVGRGGLALSPLRA